MESTGMRVAVGQRTPGSPGTDPLGWRRYLAFAGVVIYLFGQAYDTYWHARNVSFIVEPPSSLWTIHLGIWLGAAVTAAAGATQLRLSGFRVAGVLLVVGGGVELAGFFLDMWKHSQETSLDFYHDLVWYGFGVVVVAMVRLEAMRRNRLGAAHRVNRPGP
ncbi:hypothetical protein ABT063_33320 [Streptomyces sp. NPDC002838]|uniref:hypothetical protein n=1 Tax=Streptomyces sp. NPDC002838 TaxID=3154436 RepID=UPI00331893BC